MSPRLTTFLTGAFANQVLAHGILTKFTANGVKYDGFATESIYKIQNGNPAPDVAAWSTAALDRGYIEPNSMSTQDINCHKDAAPGVLTVEVAAGSSIDFVWADWPHDQSPVLTYIAPCNGDCATVDKSTLEWIKIDEAGFDGEWAGKKLMDNDFTWSSKIPSTIAAGNYVVRNEIINLHSGMEPNGAQLYPQCVNVKITGSGTDTPKGTLGVNLYKPDDAGILFDGNAKGISNYPIPGPPLYVAGEPAVSFPASSASGSTQGPSASTAIPVSLSSSTPIGTAVPATNGTPTVSAVPTTLVTSKIARPTSTVRARPSGCRAYNASKSLLILWLTELLLIAHVVETSHCISA